MKKVMGSLVAVAAMLGAVCAYGQGGIKAGRIVFGDDTEMTTASAGGESLWNEYGNGIVSRSNELWIAGNAFGSIDSNPEGAGEYTIASWTAAYCDMQVPLAIGGSLTLESVADGNVNFTSWTDNFGNSILAFNVNAGDVTFHNALRISDSLEIRKTDTGITAFTVPDDNFEITPMTIDQVNVMFGGNAGAGPGAGWFAPENVYLANEDAVASVRFGSKWRIAMTDGTNLHFQTNGSDPAAWTDSLVFGENTLRLNDHTRLVAGVWNRPNAVEIHTDAAVEGSFGPMFRVDTDGADTLELGAFGGLGELDFSDTPVVYFDDGDMFRLNERKLSMTQGGTERWRMAIDPATTNLTIQANTGDEETPNWVTVSEHLFPAGE